VARLLPLSAERAGAKGPTLGTPFPLPLRCIYPSSSSQSNALSRGSGQSQQQIETHFAGKGYGELKRIVADLIIMTLGPIQERYYALMDDQTALDALLQKGTDTARERAAVTLRTAKERVGLWALP
jgi:hypothetical protein